MLYRRLVHVGETFNRFWAVNCTKMRLADGLSVIRGRGGNEGKGKVWELGRRKERT